MRAAQLDDNNIVINMIEVEQLDVLPNLIDGTGGNIGDTWDGAKFIPTPTPVEPPPDSVSMRQARLQLLALGSYDIVNAAISTMPEAAQIEWEYATEVQRSNPLVAGIQALLQWTDEQLDTYFTEAAKL